MANPTTRGRGAGSPARRTMTAAARAAAKRTQRGEPTERTERVERTERAAPERRLSGRTLLVEAPDDGWDDPPEPSPEFAEAVAAAEPAEPADVADTADAGDTAVRAPRPWRRPLTLVLAVLLLAGLVAAAVLGRQYLDGRQAGQARQQALAAARAAAPVVLSYDYRHLERDFARARTHLTGKFGDEYRRTTKAVVGPTARKYHGVVKATVAEPAGGGAPAASVVSASADRAVVLLFVNQVTRSTQVTGSRVDLNRVRMTLTRTSEGWKVSAVDAL
ncbi:hypothetical protein [Streptomyces lomondensis]|uniref:Mce-associated membrane protein n=1 Tax=Streptomyces lomondensis TaxID=68229 RepID=A0ABQ2XTH2_9ACTN|nr:hypothetical protein [Streptomyces lomondensis]MCF0080912.1 hypothetical protein [Streptomyces lomondensis]GGX31252.1 hypothetical protein GCM10010383_72010 [Streptomyces lomondensis]